MHNPLVHVVCREGLKFFNNLLYADIIFLAAARIFGKRTTPNELQKGLFA